MKNFSGLARRLEVLESLSETGEERIAIICTEVKSRAEVAAANAWPREIELKGPEALEALRAPLVAPFKETALYVEHYTKSD